MNVFTAIGDFFIGLFSPEGEQRNKRELRQVRQIIKDFKPTLFKFGGKQVLPPFANAVQALVTLIKPLNDIFERSVLISDVRIARRFWDWLLEQRLGPREYKLLESLYYENLMTRFKEDPDRQGLIARVQAEGGAVLKALDDPAMKVVDTELREFERIVDICRHDYVRLLRYFTSPDQRKTKGGKVKFQAAEGESLVGDLADLYSVVSGARMTPAVQRDILLLAKRAGGESAASLEKRLPRIASQINTLLDTIFSDQIIAALLQLIKEDSSYLPPSPVQPPARLTQYRDTFARRFKDDVDRIQREIRESALSAEITALFGTPPAGGLMSVASYNSDLNTRLQTEAGISLRFTMPFRLLKTFERRFVTREFLDACKRVVIEGFFNNTLFRSRMTDAIGKIEKAQARISIFEESTATQGRASCATLRRALDEMLKGKVAVDAVERIASSLDGRAKELIEQEVVVLRELAEFVHDVIVDFKRPTPDLVINIKTLASAKEKKLIPTLLNAYNAIARLLRIMKSFMVVMPIAGANEEL